MAWLYFCILQLLIPNDLSSSLMVWSQVSYYAITVNMPKSRNLNTFKENTKQAESLRLEVDFWWVYDYLKQNGYNHYVELTPPADIVGDIRDWEKFGFKRGTHLMS